MMPLPTLQDLIADVVRPFVGDLFDLRLFVKDDLPAGDDDLVDDPRPEETEA